MTTFEELPLARKTPDYDGRNVWTADYEVPAPSGALVTYASVRAVVDESKVSELRLRKEQRGNYMLGQLVDVRGVIYGMSGTYIGGPSVVEASDPGAMSRVDVARARLIDLASAWRRAGLQMETEHFDTAHAVIYANCAQQLDEVVVELLTSGEGMGLDFDDVDDGRDG